MKRKVFACLLSCIMMFSSIGIADDRIDMELITNSKLITIAMLEVGSGVGQVGYGGIEPFGFTGPESFAVEDGIIYILDSVNKRIMIGNSKEYFSFDISVCPNATHMKYQDQRIGVVDNDAGITAVYSIKGSLEKVILHPDEIKNAYVSSLVELGDTHVIWKTYGDEYYRYDWNEEIFSHIEYNMKRNVVSDSVVEFSSLTSENQWFVNQENRDIGVLGVTSQDLVYQQYQYVPNVDMLFTELSVRKIDVNGQETYAIIDFSDWYVPAMEALYYSTDGKIYVMECFEGFTRISEVKLGTTDISRMSELEAMADERRAEIAADKEEQINSDIVTEYSSSRSVVSSRARQMLNYTWTVTAEDKTSRANVVIPDSVQNTAIGSTYTGIPYCWGRANGVDSIPMGSSFSSLRSKGGYTTGNVNTQNGTNSNTIGLDCVGFLCQAYDFTTATKPHSSKFINFGNATSYGSLKLMDCIVKNGHVLLFYTKNSTGIVSYECLKTSGTEGKTSVMERTQSQLANDGYVYRNLFCSSCNKTGPKEITPSTHTLSCSSCDYIWPTQGHLFISGKCSICGYSQ